MMTLVRALSSAWVQAGAAALAGMMVAGVAFSAGAPHVVSQVGREFHPREITIDRGETLQVVNDDGDLLHHVYIDSDQMQFDSGDQKPGSHTNIEFSKAGNYAVLCAIHPKMKLIVHVR
jgi:plastocyanin